MYTLTGKCLETGYWFIIFQDEDKEAVQFEKDSEYMYYSCMKIRRNVDTNKLLEEGYYYA